jgi:hypothetical protein
MSSVFVSLTKALNFSCEKAILDFFMGAGHTAFPPVWDE